MRRRGDLHDAFGLVVGGEKLIVEEAVEDVAYENFEPALDSRGGCGLRLDGEREDGMSVERRGRACSDMVHRHGAGRARGATLCVSCCWTSWAKTLSRLASAREVLSSAGGASARILALRDDDDAMADQLDHLEDMRDVEDGFALRRRAACSRSLKRRAETTSRPESGSSKIRSLGSCRSAAAMRMRCFMPLE